MHRPFAYRGPVAPVAGGLRWHGAFAAVALAMAGLGGATVAGCGVKSLDGIDPGGTGAGPGTGRGGTGGASVPGTGGDATCAGVPGTGMVADIAKPGLVTPSALRLDGLVTAAVPPPPISGGTLLVLADGNTAVAGDADRDRLFFVDLSTQAVRSLGLMPHDEPGRLVQDGAGMVHVLLRGPGQLLTVNPVSGTATQRRAVCAVPRGLAYDPAANRLHVACGGGELVTFTAGGVTPERTLKLPSDLRDVVVDGGRLLVTRFRTAEVLVVDAGGTMKDIVNLPAFRHPAVHGGTPFSPAVAWRATAMPGGGMVMSHQRGMDGEVGTVGPAGYGGLGSCDSIVHSSVTRVKADERPVAGPALPAFVLPVDLAVSPNGRRVAVVAAGNGHSDPIATERLFVTDMDAVTNEWQDGCSQDGHHGPGQCAVGGPVIPPDAILPPNPDGACPPQAPELCKAAGLCVNPMFVKCDPVGGIIFPAVNGTGGSAGSGVAGAGGAGGSVGGASGAGSASGTSTGGASGTPACGMRIPDAVEPVSVVFAGDSRVVVQTREPAALYIVTEDGGSQRVMLSQESRADTGHIVFHANSGGGLACASCHPEGHEDGRVWTFQCEGTRRTQDLAGGLSSTAPFHWNGDLGTFPTLMDTVFVGRMSGPPLTREQGAAALKWIDSVPAHKPLRAATDPVVARGKALFENADVGCATCHTGTALTNNKSVDVATAGLFQVPSLRGLSGRAPFMHDGCADSLITRFTDPLCGGGDKHGKTSQLMPSQLSDLVGYLESL